MQDSAHPRPIPPLCIQQLLLNLMQSNLHIYQPEAGTLLSQSRAALLQRGSQSIPSQHWPWKPQVPMKSHSTRVMQFIVHHITEWHTGEF